MVIRYGKHSSDQFTTATNVQSVSPIYEDGQFVGYKVACVRDETKPMGTDNMPIFGRIFVNKDFDPDCFEVSADEDVPCTWILKEKILRLGVDPENHSNFESFLEAIKRASGNEESTEEFAPIFP